MRNLLNAIQTANVVERVEGWRQPAMQTENLETES